MRTLKWGVLGTGNIVGKMGPAILAAQNSDWLAIAGRNSESSMSAAIRFGVPRAYPSYQDLINDPDIDAVYIALLNHLHLKWALQAIAAGKHVLCEKPMTLTAAEALQVKEAAQRSNIQVMEAFVWRFLPVHQRVKQLLTEGHIGEAVQVNAHFSIALRDAASSTRMVKAWGGGCLYDIGCYPVSFSRFLLGAEPEAVDARLTIDPRTGVDTRFVGTLYFASGRCAQLSSAFDQSGGCFYEVIGTKGRIRTSPIRFNSPTTLWVSAADETKELYFEAQNQYVLQVEAFTDAILQGQRVPYGPLDAVCNMQVIDALFAADRTQTRTRVY
ncbi:MAG: oxidoreductase [Bacilli bacterium]|nr:oxidoreductase [Bacilli bacterium]